MSKVFPRVTKCTFQKYGPSGTIQNHDAQVTIESKLINVCNVEKTHIGNEYSSNVLYATIASSVCFQSTSSMKKSMCFYGFGCYF